MGAEPGDLEPVRCACAAVNDQLEKYSHEAHPESSPHRRHACWHDGLTSAHAQARREGGQPMPDSTRIPQQIMTPEMIETRLGTLKFVDGVPTAETAQEVC